MVQVTDIFAAITITKSVSKFSSTLNLPCKQNFNVYEVKPQNFLSFIIFFIHS